MKKIDQILNSMTMYRLVVYGLGIVVCAGLVFALLGHFSFTATDMLVSLLFVIVPAYTANRGFGRLFNTPTNSESWLITSLILFLILPPAGNTAEAITLALAGALSSASKFIVAYKGKHIFNPAAFAAAFASLTGLQATTWWVGSTALWPFTLVVGLAVVRKIRRFPLFITFVVVSVVLQVVLFSLDQRPLASSMQDALVASPFIFLSTIMLTEPATMPPRRNQQIIFATGVAVLYVTAWKLGPIYIYPEVALLLGNIYAYAVSPRFRARLQLKEVQQISDKVYNYIFQPETRFNFLPGQYMEWTLDGVPYDSRGNRRTFTIASSPSELDVSIGLKYYDPSSAYKAAFYQLQPGDSIYASQLAGNFTLNGNENKKLAFIAGGIGITPFRSIIKDLILNKTTGDILVIYVVPELQELAYLDVFKEAKQYGVKLIPVVTKQPATVQGVIYGRLSMDVLVSAVPDYAERIFYISGPNSMVDATKGYLRSLKVSRTKIKTDHFSGY